MKNAITTSQLILQLTLANSALASTNVKELSLNCQATAQVESVREAAYHPGLPPKGRFSGIAPSSDYKALVKVKTLSPDCAQLKEKYGLSVDGFTLEMSVGTVPVFSQNEIEAFAQASVGSTIPITLKQSFSYKTKEGWLPLFPKVHGESLWFEGKLSISGTKVHTSFWLKPDLSWVYGIKPVEEMSEIEKLSLAEAAADQLVWQGFWSDFDSLLLNLEPQTPGLKKVYAMLIWGVFHQVKVKNPYHEHVLDFHVGGEGSFFGRPLIAKVLDFTSAPGAFSEAETAALIEDLPTILLAYSYEGDHCLNYSPVALENALSSLLMKFPTLSLGEKSYLKDPLAQVAGQVNYMVAGQCVNGKVSAKAKAIAEQLLELL